MNAGRAGGPRNLTGPLALPRTSDPGPLLGPADEANVAARFRASKGSENPLLDMGCSLPRRGPALVLRGVPDAHGEGEVLLAVGVDRTHDPIELSAVDCGERHLPDQIDGVLPPDGEPHGEEPVVGPQQILVTRLDVLLGRRHEL